MWKTLLLLCASLPLQAVDRQVAITIDDLPRGGDHGDGSLAGVRTMTRHLLRPFQQQKVPVIAFVNQGREVDFSQPELGGILRIWLDAGAELGNHSYSHRSINNMPLVDYTDDIVRGEPILRSALAGAGKSLRYYRHPFLHTGTTPEIRRQVEEFLAQHGYRVAPVTIDTADYLYARLYTIPRYQARCRREYVRYLESVVAFFEKRSVDVVGREVPQILLLHANRLNADRMPAVLAMFRRRGYRFISLEQALQDDAYRLPDGYTGRKGISWIHRWGVAKGIPIVLEPEPPQWAQDAWTAATRP